MHVLHVCLSVCPCSYPKTMCLHTLLARYNAIAQCPSVWHKLWSCLKMDQWIWLFSAPRLPPANPTGVTSEFRHLQNMDTSLWNVFSNSVGQRNFARYIDYRKCYQLQSDHYRSITLYIHLCVPHYRWDTVHHVSSSGSNNLWSAVWQNCIINF